MAMTARAVRGLPAAAQILVGSVVVGGGLALAVAISWTIPMEERSAFALLAIAGAVALGSQLVLTFPHAGETEQFSLEESVWIAALVLAPRGIPTVGAVIGTIAWQFYRRTDGHKVAFNAGQVAVAMLTAEAVYGLVERRDASDPVAWLVAAVALAVCSLINASTVSLVISVIQGERFRTVLLKPWRVNVLSWFGNVSIGLLAAVAWKASPWGLLLVAAPMGLLYVAYRGWLAQTVESELMEDIAHAADEITRDGNLGLRLPMGEASPRLFALTATLNRMLERIESSFLRQRRFMRDAAHELREPVSALRRGVAKPDSRQAFEMTSELDRISRVLDDMASLARADAPGFIRLQPTAIGPFLEEVATTAVPLLGDRLTATTPAADARADIDPARMRQVLLSLLENAATHGGDAARVTLTVVDEPDAWRFEVADEGGGVPAGHEEAIFEPFYRATGGGHGPGLGLALVRTVAGAHGGSAGIVNRPGRGVTFWVRVPA